jgi:DNA invertase Pin-like site-specific DNA recombinase
MLSTCRLNFAIDPIALGREREAAATASSERQSQWHCRKRAELEGWTIVATFADAAMSGSDANRPRYRAMLEAAVRREFDVLIVDDLSRLTRALLVES